MATEIAPSIGGSKGIAPLGPYRATKLWNEVIRAFRHGQPVGRHRRYMKSYENCFVASEAVTWLHDYLCNSPNFGPTVSRIQTLQLMQKFQKAGLFEDVRGAKYLKAELTDGSKLYRFRNESPVKPSRAPLAQCTALMNANTATPSDPLSLKLDACKLSKMDAVESESAPQSECHLVAKSHVTPQEIEEIWKKQTLESLRLILRLDSLKDIVEPDFIFAPDIMHNLTQVNKNGVVTNIDKSDQLPHWVMSAMRCLAYWPDKVESNLPDYPGFEKDVFKAVKKYFEGPEEPLTSFAMYEMFISVMAHLDNIQRPRCSFNSVSSTESSKHLTSYVSVENLMANMTLNARMHGDMDLRPSEIMIVHDPDLDSTCPEKPVNRVRSQVNLKRSVSSASMLTTKRVETFFGVQDNVPCTRWYETEQGEWMPETDEVFEDERHSVLSERSHVKGRRGSYGDISKSANRTVCNGTVSSRHSVHTPYKDEVDRYGYTVVLSSAPRVVQVEAPGMPWRKTPIGRQRLQSQYMGRRDYSKWGGSCGSLASSSTKPTVTNPPPYIPPPSYNSFCSQKSLPRAATFRGRSDVSSSCSSYRSDSPAVEGRRGRSVSSMGHYSTQSVPADVSQCSEDPYGRHSTLSRCKSKSSMTESYRLAIDANVTAHGACTPVGRSLYGALQRCESSPGLFQPTSHDRVVDALQVCCLLLPPANRRKLHFLLRLMNKMANNKQLVLDESVPTRELVLQMFTRCILRSQDEADFDDYLTQRAVTLMMDNYVEVMKVPERLKQHIEVKVEELKKSRVSKQEYESQKLSGSQRALEVLLDDIVNDRASSQKDKKRRLKQFQKNYPNIYHRRFATSRSESDLFPSKPKVKPALLSRPLHKLRSLRM